MSDGVQCTGNNILADGCRGSGSVDPGPVSFADSGQYSQWLQHVLRLVAQEGGSLWREHSIQPNTVGYLGVGRQEMGAEIPSIITAVETLGFHGI